jgi:hypothetical protein
MWGGDTQKGREEFLFVDAIGGNDEIKGRVQGTYVLF